MTEKSCVEMGSPELLAGIRPSGDGERIRRIGGGISLLLSVVLLSPEAVTIAGARSSVGPAGSQVELPESCRSREKASAQVTRILEALANRPTAEVFSTLGALYAEQKDYRCALPAFEIALRLDSRYWQARYNLATALMQQGDFRRAEAELRTIVRQKPDAAAPHNALGMLLQSSGQKDAALEEFKKALDADPHFTSAALNLAQILSDQKRYSAAIFYLNRAFAAGPSQDLVEQLLLALGMAYAQDGNFKAAIGTMQRAISMHPDSRAAHYNLGTVYAKEGVRAGYEAAVGEYQKCLQLNPSDAAARISLAKALMSLQRCREVMFQLQDYTRREPEDYEGFYVLGSAYKELGQFDAAEAALLKAARLNPANYDVRYDLGFVLGHNGKPREGIEQLEAAEKLDPDAPEAHYQLALLLQKIQQSQRATEELNAFQKLKGRITDETTAGNLINDANRLLAEGKTQESVESYQKAVALSPRNAQWRYNLSLALEKIGNSRGAELELERAIELDPNLATAHNELGSIYLAQERPADAEHEFKTALDIRPAYFEALDNLGTLYGRQGNDHEAVKALRQAIQANPEFAKGHVDLAMTLACLGNFLEAKREFQNALTLDPGNENALTGLGMLEGKMGHSDEAVGLFQKVISRRPDSADAHLNLGIALADRLDLQGALKEFSEAVRLNPDSPIAHYNRGRVLYDLGKKNETRPELQTAIRLSPDFAPALYLLALVEGLSPETTEILKRVVQLDPQNAQAEYLLGQNFNHHGDTENAIRHWKMAAKIDPDNYSALYNLARTLSKSGDPDARQYMDRFVSLQRARQITDRVQELNNFALDFADARNWTLAIAQLKEAVEICGQCPQRATLHRNLGLIYVRRGDLEHGKRELQTALDIDPKDADALKAIGIIQHLQEKSSKSN